MNIVPLNEDELKSLVLLTTRTVSGLGAKIIGPKIITKLGLYVIMVPTLI